MFLTMENISKMDFGKRKRFFYILALILFSVLTAILLEMFDSNNSSLLIFKYAFALITTICALLFLLILICSFLQKNCIYKAILICSNVLLGILYVFLLPIGLINLGYRIVSNENFTDIFGLPLFILKIGIVISIIYVIHIYMEQNSYNNVLYGIIIVFFIMYGAMVLVDKYVLNISARQSYNLTGMAITISLLLYYMFCIFFKCINFVSEGSFALFVSFYGIFQTFLSQRSDNEKNQNGSN